MAHEPRPPMMREASTELAVEPDEAWEVVSDPTTYPDWLVGAVEIVAVDDAWPEPGSSFRHRVGIAGPLTTSDTTTVELVEAPRWGPGRFQVAIRVAVAERHATRISGGGYGPPAEPGTHAPR